jgi:murein L,D-transpeptidase YafK
MIAVACLGLAGCGGYVERPERVVKTGTVQAVTLGLIESLDMDRAAPILIRLYKEDSTLEVWKRDRSGRFALLKSYPICRFSGTLGPKQTEGDHQAPEGFYEITPGQLNPFSREYLAFNIGFPNAFDRSLGRTGSFLMVHGGCKSVGCYAMTDEQMDEIYGLAYEAFQNGQERIQLEAFPFRMTVQNLARHAEDPNAHFWSMLKQGSDAFLATKAPPAVAACGQQYVFNVGFSEKDLDPMAPCPPGIGATAGVRDELPARAATYPLSVSSAVAESYQAGDPIGRLIDQDFKARR